MAPTSLQCHFVVDKSPLAFSVHTGELDTVTTQFSPAARRRPSVSEAVVNHHIYQHKKWVCEYSKGGGILAPGLCSSL